MPADFVSSNLEFQNNIVIFIMLWLQFWISIQKVKILLPFCNTKIYGTMNLHFLPYWMFHIWSILKLFINYDEI